MKNSTNMAFTTNTASAAAAPARKSSALAWSIRCAFLPPLLAACMGSAVANPSNPTVVNGQVTFSQQGNVFTITNSPNAIINWSSFSINAGEMVRFIQQNSSSSVLNRITGQDPSRIMGALESNGRVFLINPNGIMFGAGAQVNVAGLVASTLNLSNSDFLAGKNKFLAGDVAGAVSNLGAITTPSGGQVYLIAPDVTNSGIITSPKGEVVLAAGRSVQLADSSNPDIQVVVSAPTDRVLNLGEVIAQGGKVGIYGALINQRGKLNANSAVVGENGKIILKSSGTTLLEAGSVTTATGAGSGGEVQVLGEKVGLMGDALVDVSGQTAGGTALIGGDYQGKNAAVQNAEQVYVGKDARIKADAIASGNGGKVIVWGNQTAQVYGSIFARGGAQSGNGGFIETSGNFLDVAGVRINASAQYGTAGKWLLDPLDIVIADTMGPTASLDDVSAFSANANDVTEIFRGTVSNAIGVAHGASVILQAKRNITFDGSVNIDMPNVGITAQAGNNIVVNAFIASGGGDIVLSANDNGAGTATGSGRVIMNAGGSLNARGGNVTIRDSTTSPPTPTPPPSADICTIAPNSALCQVLSPPSASEPVKPVQQAANEIIKTVTTSAPKLNSGQQAFFDPAKSGSSSSGSSGGSSSGGSGSASERDAVQAAENARAAKLAADAAANAAADAAKRAAADAANQAAKDAAADASAKATAAEAAAQAAADAAAKAQKEADDKKADDTKSDANKTDTKEAASNDKSGTKNEPVKKMYCN